MALLATPLNGMILRKLSEGPKRQVDLRQECGSPAQTTLRAHLRELEDVGTIDKRRGNRFPGAVECVLTTAGAELLFVADAIDHWLRQAPDGPVAFGSNEAKAAIKSLVEGWSSTMLRALAARPLSLTELDGLISGLSYPSLERRLAAMKLAGQVETCPGEGKGTPYTPTQWLRRGIAPLVTAIRWERRHLPDDTVPFSRVDAEAAFLLALPPLRLRSELSGACRMGVEMSNGKERRLVGAMAYVEQGRIASCSVRLENNVDAWVTGTASAWLHAVVASDTDGLELGGHQNLARALLDSLHLSLFGAKTLKTAL